MNTSKPLRIMLACAGGMSTSLLVTKMEKAAAEKKIDAVIWATSVNQARETWNEADVLLIGPQVRWEYGVFERKIGDKIPFAVIDMRDYGTMNGEKVLQTALDLLNIE